MFTNDSKPETKDLSWRNASIGHFGYDKPSKYLFQWSRLLQAIISQAGTYMLTGKFHDSECGIHKVEGGCRIQGVGELVLSHDCCYFDRYNSKTAAENHQKLAALITELVLKFDPMQPRESLYATAAEHVRCDAEKLKNVIENSRVGGVFGGDALADFFRWNPFSSPPVDREYKRWAVVEYLKKMTNEELDQLYADQDLGKELLEKLQEYYREKKFFSSPLCCSPSRGQDGLRFWVNTGRNTQMDGWKTEKEIRDFMKSGQDIKDRARY